MGLVHVEVSYGDDGQTVTTTCACDQGVTANAAVPVAGTPVDAEDRYGCPGRKRDGANERPFFSACPCAYGRTGAGTRLCSPITFCLIRSGLARLPQIVDQEAQSLAQPRNALVAGLLLLNTCGPPHDAWHVRASPACGIQKRFLTLPFAPSSF